FVLYLSCKRLHEKEKIINARFHHVSLKTRYSFSNFCYSQHIFYVPSHGVIPVSHRRCLVDASTSPSALYPVEGFFFARTVCICIKSDLPGQHLRTNSPRLFAAQLA